MASPQLPNDYGSPITLDVAKQAAARALAEARKNGWTVAVAVVDTGGHLVYFERLDATQLASADIAIAKARSAALYKRPSKTFQEALAGGGAGLRVLRLKGAVPIDGGVPLLLNDRIVGGIGVSGAIPQQDGQCANAGAEGLSARNAS